MQKYKMIMLDYLQALEQKDIGKILSLFSKNAVVHSPLYGDVPAKNFYEDLMKATENSVIKFKQTYAGEKPNSAALNFEYDWTLTNGEKIVFNCVDLFEFDSADKIKELFIIYDTHPIRAGFNDVRHGV